MSDIIDLRSDTLTKPSQAMRQAMFEAPVGDDVFGEDPTVIALEEKAADMLGREAAMFVPSGTMANQLALRILTQSGDEVLIEGSSHPFVYESGAPAVISGLMLRPLEGRRGLLTPEQIEAEIRPDDVHFAPTRAVAVENTHNRGGGSVYTLETLAAIREVTLRRGLKMHLDGARLFNACQAAKVLPRDYAAQADTVSFCLSKGLGAPVGSLLAADAELIRLARRWRKVLGGGMRQAGILAAAGIYALDHNVDRLAEDHENAQVLARGLAEIDGLEIDPSEVESNIVIFNISRPGLPAMELVERFKKAGVLSLAFGPDKIRTVTHLDVNRSDIEKAINIISRVMKA